MKKGLKILLVEDLPSDAELAKREIDNGLGPAAVIVVDTQPEFTEILSNFKPDVIVSDFKLPSFDGLTALSIARETTRFTPFIILTGSMNEDTAVDCMKAGADDYVIKEHIKRLVPSIRQALERKKIEKAHHQAVEALQESEERYRAVVEHSHDGIIVIDDKYTITYINNTASTILGRPPREILNHNFGEFLDDESRKLVADRYRKRRQGKTVPSKYEFSIIRKNGEKRQVTISAAIWENSRGDMFSIAQILDITDKKTAEDALRRERNLLARITDTSPVGITVTDSTGNIVFANRCAEEILGLSKDEITSRTYNMPQWHITAVDGSPFPDTNLPFNQVRQTGKPVYDIEHAIEGSGSEGGRIILSINASPLLDSRGGFEGMVATIEDITERKHIETIIRDSEIKFRTLVNQTPEALFLHDMEGHIVDVNDVCVDRYGFSREELFSMSAQDIDPDYTEREHDGRFWEALKTKKHVRLEARHQRKDGSVFPVRISLASITLEGIPHVIALAEDISERKEAEAALKESEAKYRNLIENSNDAIYLLYEGTFEIINKKFQELLGVTQKQVKEPGFDMMSMVSPSDRHIIENRLARVQQGDFTPSRYQFTAVRHDGTEIVLDASISYVPYKQGMAAQGLLRDITQQIESENRIKKTLGEKEVMLKEIHHRVKNNLNVITSLLNLQVGKIDSKEQAVKAFNESRDRIFSMAMVHEKLYQSESLSAINMDDYTRSLAGQLMHIYRPETPVAVLFKNDNVSIDINMAIPCGLILNELITNSLKHAFKETEKGRITISFQASGNDAYRLCVSDNGCGMPLPVDIHTDKSLGLQLIRILAEQLEGSLDINVDQGTTFTVYFPADN